MYTMQINKQYFCAAFLLDIDLFFKLWKDLGSRNKYEVYNFNICNTDSVEKWINFSKIYNNFYKKYNFTHLKLIQK